MQGPHCRHGEYEDGEIGGHIGCGTEYKVKPLVDAGAMDAWVFVPDIFDRVTLEGQNKDDRDRPARHENANSVCKSAQVQQAAKESDVKR